MKSRWVAFGWLWLAFGIAAGAFAAHALARVLAPAMLTVFETGARYQQLAALAVVVAAREFDEVRVLGPGRVDTALCLLTVGSCVFSGSLYVLACTGVRAWGAVTPLGGVGMLAGLVVLAWDSWNKPSC